MQAAADVAVGEGRDRRLDGGQRQGEQVAVQPGRLGGVPGGVDLVGGEPVELGAVGDVHREVVRLGQHAVAELRGQRRDLHVELAQRVAVRLRQRGAGPDEVAVVALDDPHLLRRQPAVEPGGVHGVDAREQPRVEPDGVGVLRDPRRELALQGLHLGGGHRRAQVGPDPHHPLVRRTRALQRLDGVLERRLVVLRGDGLDLGALLGDAGVEGGAVVLVPDRVERWEREGQRARLGEGGGLGHATVLHRRPGPLARQPPEGAMDRSGLREFGGRTPHLSRRESHVRHRTPGAAPPGRADATAPGGVVPAVDVKTRPTDVARRPVDAAAGRREGGHAAARRRQGGEPRHPAARRLPRARRHVRDHRGLHPRRR